MAGPYREKVFGILAKIETTSGTDAVPVPGVDAMRVVGIPTLTIDYLEPGERDDVQTGLLMATDRTEAAGRFGRIELVMEVTGSGAAGGPPPSDPLLRAAGLSRTVAAGTSVLYSTLDTGMETVTLYCYTGGNKLIKLVGCVATVKLSAEAAKRGMMTFAVTGKVATDPAEAVVPSLTLSTISPPLFHSALTTIGAWNSATAGDPLVLKSAEVDLGNVIADRPSAGANDGLIGYLITDRRARQTMTTEVPSLGTFDPFALSKLAGASQGTSAWQIGTVVGNRLKVQTGKWSLKAPRPGAANGIVTWTLEGGLGAGALTSGREVNFLFD
jgi:hypothetical protein